MRVLPLIASLALLGAVIELVRRRRLREEFSWIWVLGAATAFLLGVLPEVRGSVSRMLGVGEGQVLTLLAILFLCGVCLDLSTRLSRIANQQKNLAQLLGTLEKRVSDAEDALDDETGSQAPR